MDRSGRKVEIESQIAERAHMAGDAAKLEARRASGDGKVAPFGQSNRTVDQTVLAETTASLVLLAVKRLIGPLSRRCR